jgi:hypothetical protein
MHGGTHYKYVANGRKPIKTEANTQPNSLPAENRFVIGSAIGVTLHIDWEQKVARCYYSFEL